MNKLMIKELLGSRFLNILALFSFVYIYANLLRFSSQYYVDELIAGTNVIAFTIHFVVLGMIARRNYVIKNMINNILIRIEQNQFILLCMKHLVVESIFIIIIIYIPPMLININKYLNVPLYFIYVLLWLFIFIGMELCMLLSIFIRKKYISILLLILPFLINLIIQLNIMYLIYS